MHLFISNDKLFRSLSEHRVNLRQLTLTNDIVLHSRDEITDSSFTNCIVKSTAGPMCSFGIEVQQKGDDFLLATNSVNVKKRAKMANDLDRLLRTVENVNYKKSANPKVQKQHREKVIKTNIFFLNIIENVFDIFFRAL